MKYLKLIPLIVIFLFSTSIVFAQDTSSSQQDNKIEELKKKVEAQELQVKLMQEQIEKQNAIVQEQQKQINELLKNKEQKETTANQPAKPADTTTVAKTIDKPAPKPVTPVESGFGKIKFNGLLQGFYVAGTDLKNTFRFRRAELKFSGQINPNVKWTVMIDPSKALGINTTSTTINGTPVVTTVSVNQASRIFQDAFITLNYLKNVTIDVGQYKIPLSQEGLQSSAALDTVERALFMSDRLRGGAFGDIRDFGVQFSGPIGKNFDYRVGIFNGTGENQNILDTNQEKALIGRFVVRPPCVKGLSVGVSGAWSNYDPITNVRRDRFGGDLVYTNKKVKFKAEVMGGVDGDIHRLGYYAHFGYRITPKIEAIFRVDSFDPNTRLETSSSNVTELDYIGGFNWNITENNFRFQVNYIRRTFNNGIQSPKNLFLANLQTSW